MSTKASILLTDKNEHWYTELGELGYPIYIEIASENVKYFSYDDRDGVIVGINGDSELAKLIQGIRQP